MPQIAQQDHLYFKVTNLSGELSSEEKAGLLEKVKSGTILDVVLCAESAKVKTTILGVNGTEIFYFSPEDGDILSRNLE